jgi:hypothetical protein
MKLFAALRQLVFVAVAVGCSPGIPSGQPYNADPDAEPTVRRAKADSIPAGRGETDGIDRGQTPSKTKRAKAE